MKIWVGGILVGVFVLLIIAENVLPLRKQKYPFLQRLSVNILLSALGFLAGSLIVRTTAMKLSSLSARQSFGLLQWLSLPTTAQVVIGFLLMDLTFYYWHRANHIFGILWRFHNVHHIDPDMDVTTSFRFHLGEILLSVPFRAAQVALLGITPLTYMVYEIFFHCMTMFHHSNLRLPIRIERWLNVIIVTPRMHGIHHSIVAGEVNSNYSTVFRFWDVLNKTLNLNAAQAKIIIGVVGYQQQKDNFLLNLLAMPFRKQRQHKPPARNSDFRAADYQFAKNILQQ